MYQIMFVFRLGSTSYLCCVGMDYIRKAMFVVSLYSPNDDVQLEHNTFHYPKALIEHFRKEKEKIDKGFYSIRTWEMDLYNKGEGKSKYTVKLKE
ncbi:hypothetical protein P4605_10265 [Priestia aryabhattai]|uniref:hypothetical protein n=1 Tax=Priestia aryabhattai TaxID=412384 RepID=UPI002E21C32B|nr:hypothetical protein [Priestia aryabhattai]